MKKTHNMLKVHELYRTTWRIVVERDVPRQGRVRDIAGNSRRQTGTQAGRPSGPGRHMFCSTTSLTASTARGATTMSFFPPTQWSAPGAPSPAMGELHSRPPTLTAESTMRLYASPWALETSSSTPSSCLTRSRSRSHSSTCEGGRATGKHIKNDFQRCGGRS